ncbi:ANTH-domain-containing protein [Bimuria novae-zelandiae CBS 107.79]|uniref:ANTH-domain-containing protein n=1 Tax=Bimuria novae-zelandiae CBS 107.79 TaxID=1447943 RepID=A0A6A5VLP7_9PLEO|nr:ANTH-domain-containing protein [Bimuria novae-zelandiae CBS 107.79]
MASSFEKSVKGGTKIKLAAPKSKYVEHILVATHAGEAGVGEIFRALTNRLRDSTWTIVYKSLIIVHLMIREGEPEVTLKFLAKNPRRTLAINHFTEVQTQGQNIRNYAEYLLCRAEQYGATKMDYVRGGEGRLKRLNIEKGLLRETESVQDQIKFLLRCEPFHDEPENEITLTAFRLLTMDLLVLFHVMNEGTINVLEHYFELSKPDAKRALDIYRTFVRQTDLVVQYLSVARLHEHSTRLEIPKIKHAPTSLTQALEEYLNDNDFEINRRQYMAEREAKKAGGKTTNGTSKLGSDTKPTATSPTQPSAPSKPPAVSLPLIDFFDSIQDNQQTMAQPQAQAQAYPQQTGFQQPTIQMPQQTAGFQQQSPPPFGSQDGQSTNPFAQMQQGMQQMNLQPMQQPQQPQPPQLQTQFTGAGFGGYTPQPFSPQNNMGQQNGMPGFLQQPMMAEPLQPQPTSTNPFRASLLPPAQPIGAAEPKLLGNPTGASSPLGRSPTNPFAKHSTGGFQSSLPPTFEDSASSNFSVPPMQSPPANSPFAPQPQQQMSLQPLQPAPTGTNPFARNVSPVQGTPSPQGGLTVHATGSTNPFRQSAFVNQQTGQGWQGSGQGTLGGMHLDAVPTTNVFPRPGQQQQPNYLG